MIQSRYILLSSVAAIAVAHPAFAQDAEGERETGARQLDTVVVTAQKRESNLQDTPISVSAVTGENLEANGDVTVQDIALTTPGLVVGGNAAFEYSVSLRGISSAAAGIGADAPTGTYVDGVYIGRPAGAIFDLADIDRIEVLRGPQGTLYGRNTVGGAISVFTEKPTDEFEGVIKGTIAERGIARVAGALSGPIVEDRLNGRISASYGSTDAWVSNISGPDILDTESIMLRGALEFTPSDTVSFLLRADYGDLDDPLYSKNITTDAVFPPQTNPELIGDFDTVSLSEENFQTREFWGVSLESTFDIGELTLTSITAYRDNEHVYQLDTDGSPSRIFRSGHNETQDQFSQELRLTSPGNQTVDWIVGAYYFTESAQQDFYVEVLTTPINLGRFSENETTSYAIFGQADWNITDRLTATGGIRYSDEEKDFKFAFQPTLLTPAQVGDPYSDLNRFDRTVDFTEDSASFDAVTGKLGLSYQADNALYYASISQGFKSGGFNFAPFNATGDEPFDQEEVVAYEIGAKSDFADGNVQLNTSAFYYDYSDLQVRIPIVPGQILIENASDAEVYGVEFELLATPVENLFVQAGLALLESEYKDFVQEGGIIPLCTGGVTGTNNGVAFCDVSGNTLNRAPDVTFNIAAEYYFDLGETGSLTPRLAYAREGEVFYTEQNDPAFGHGGYETLDAQLTYKPAGEQFSISVFGRNLTDDRVYTHAIPIGTAPIASGINEPRTYGLSFKAEF